MAIEQGTETVIIAVQERTWRLEIFTEKGADPTVRAHRETVRIDTEGNVISRDRDAVVERSLSQVANEEFSIGGKSYTGGELANALSSIADTWRQQDIDAAEAAIAAE